LKLFCRGENVMRKRSKRQDHPKNKRVLKQRQKKEGHNRGKGMFAAGRGEVLIGEEEIQH